MEAMYDQSFTLDPSNRPRYRAVPDYWDHILKGNHHRVFTFIYFHVARLIASNTGTVKKYRKRANGGVWCQSPLIAERLGCTEKTVNNAIAYLDSIGLLIRVSNPSHAREELRRVFFVNHAVLKRLDAAYMSVNTDAWHERYDSYEEYEDAKQEAVMREWDNFITAGREAAIEQLITEYKVTLPPAVKITATPGDFYRPSYLDNIKDNKEVSSSKKPVVPSGTTCTPAAPPVTRRRVPEGLASSETPLFKRKPVLDAKTGQEAPCNTLAQHERYLLEYWNSKDTLRTHKIPSEGSAPTNTVRRFITDLKKLMGGTLFKGLQDVDPCHVRAYSVAEVRKAIDAFALADPVLRDGVGLDTFLFNPNRVGGRNGFGRSWFLAALHNDVRGSITQRADDHPDLTQNLIKQYRYYHLRNNPVQFDTRDMNSFIQSTEKIFALYAKYEERFRMLNYGPIDIMRKAVEVSAHWAKRIDVTPATMHCDSLFKAIEASMLKSGVVQQDSADDETTVFDIYAPRD